MATTKIVVQKVKVSTTTEHIETGKCGDPRKCMERQAIAQALKSIGIQVNKLRVDAGHVRGVWGGWRWVADTPRAARNSLVQWDDDLRHGRNITVRPHKYSLIFRRWSRVRSSPMFTKERRQQINEARKAREAASGISDKRRYSRVVGYTYI